MMLHRKTISMRKNIFRHLADAGTAAHCLNSEVA